MKTSRYKKGDEPDRIDLRHLMPPFPGDPASRFLDYYQRYLIAKGQQNGEMIWLCAVVCRIELRKMGDPTEEAENCQKLFKGFVSQKGAAQMYRELYDDSQTLSQ
jgi:hypothetical protein